MICIDSEHDEAAEIVANWRRSNLYPLIHDMGENPIILQGNMAERRYFKTSLLENGKCFVSGSGHGTYKEYLATSGKPLLEVDEFEDDEVEGKIIHLLSCNTAFRLGRNVVEKGCLAFLGYDKIFSFPEDEYHDEFMFPDKELVLKVCEGITVGEVHEHVLGAYDAMIATLKSNGASPYYVQLMAMNKDFFCSPAKSDKWGNPLASKGAFV